MTAIAISRLTATVARTELLRALQLCETVVPRGDVIPILRNVKLESTGNDRLRIVGTDIDVTAKCSVPATIALPGSITVEARPFIDAVKSGADENVSLELCDNDRLSLKCGTASFALPVLPAEDFPTEPTVEGGAAIEVETELFRSMMRAVSFATIAEEVRFQLNGVLLAASRKSLELVATDGHRLAMATYARPYGEVAKVLVPPKAIKAIDRLVGDTLTLTLGTQLGATAGEDSILARLVDVNFPNYRDVIAICERKCRADRERLLQVVRRAQLFSHERTKAVRFKFTKGRLTADAMNVERGTAIDYMPIDYSGPDVTVGMAGHYVAQALDAIDTDFVEIGMTGPDGQAQFRPEPQGDIEQLHVVMPMRLVEEDGDGETEVHRSNVRPGRRRFRLRPRIHSALPHQQRGLARETAYDGGVSARRHPRDRSAR